jgi:putative phage-type endonuclease
MHAYQQNTDEWLEMRRNKIGASDASVIMEASPWDTPYTLWERKVGIRPEKVLNRSMQRGNDLEECARQAYMRITKLNVFDLVVFHPKNVWMMASLDGIDIEGKNIVEIKCPGAEDHDLALHGFIPPKYYPQMQHQMEVTGLNSAHYFSFDGERGVIVNVERNQSYIDRMVQKETEFYECMQSLEPPKLTDRDYVEKYDEVWTKTAQEWLSVQNELEDVKAREEELREMLVFQSSKTNTKGAGIKVSRMIRKGAVDYKLVPELQGVDLNQYRKPTTECWRISKT